MVKLRRKSRVLVVVAQIALGISAASQARESTVALLALDETTHRELPLPWQLKSKVGRPELRIEEEGGLLAVCLTSRSSSFSIQRKADIDSGRFPLVNWKWLASELPRQGDLRRNEADDQAAQLFVLFDGGRAISYVWDSTAPVGTVVETRIPLLLTIKALVVESGTAKLGTWQTYRRNVEQDYRRLFVGRPPPIKALRFQINSQHTQASSRSCIADIYFSASR